MELVAGTGQNRRASAAGPLSMIARQKKVQRRNGAGRANAATAGEQQRKRRESGQTNKIPSYSHLPSINQSATIATSN